MASLRRLKNSPYWIACFTLPDGRRTQRSTATTDKREAQRIANTYEDASKEAREGKFTGLRARKTIADIFALGNNDSLPSSTIQSFFDSWIKRKELEAGEKTFRRYKTVIDQFLLFLGSQTKRDIAHLSSKEITLFRDKLSQKRSTGTVNISVKIIRAALSQAKRDGIIDSNEAERVTLLKRTDKFERRPFTIEELKRIFEVANKEWQGMILFGLYTGQRLSDLASLCWNNIDLQRQEMRLVTAKTSRRQIIPLAKPLLDYLESLEANDEVNAPLFPNIHATWERNTYSGTLSNQFTQILVAAGLLKNKSHKSTGKGRSAKREQNEISFHALRHTTTSLLKNAGISNAIAQEFVGHDSAEISKQYTHIDSDAMRKAANALPSIVVKK
jgi:integrase